MLLYQRVMERIEFKTESYEKGQLSSDPGPIAWITVTLGPGGLTGWEGDAIGRECLTVCCLIQTPHFLSDVDGCVSVISKVCSNSQSKKKNLIKPKKSQFQRAFGCYFYMCCHRIQLSGKGKGSIQLLSSGSPQNPELILLSSPSFFFFTVQHKATPTCISTFL